MTSQKNYWLLGVGEKGRFWDDFKNKSLVAVAPDETGDLTQYNSDDAIENKLCKVLGETPKHKNNTLLLWQFSREMQKGDIVIIKKGTKELLGYGEITSDYFFDDSRKEYKHVRKVKWEKVKQEEDKREWIYPFDEKEGGEQQFAQKTLTKIDADWAEKYIKYIANMAAGIESESEDSVIEPEEVSYWWLKVNPQIWNINQAKVGDRQFYTSHNEKGNKRRIYKYFEKVKPGDVVLGYVSSPDMELTTICKITQGLHVNKDKGEAIEFEVVEKISEPVSYEELKKIPELSNCEPLLNRQGSLFKLEKKEYDAIRDFIDEKNPPSEDQPADYTIKDALENLFLESERFEEILKVLKLKKNVILQGAPGVGKTFIAKRLAYALIGAKASRQVQMIQFHQSYSYEDFIQGYRPGENGSFELKNGVFYQFCKKAQRDAGNKYVFIIDEINRGNLSKIFGEVMMLIEPDKRGEEYAVPLAYASSSADTFFIPENLYLIGTMNTADRSLAFVDYALRRRFSFITLEPQYNSKQFATFLINKGIAEALVERIRTRMTELNERIANDASLGNGYRIGHSFFCSLDEQTGGNEEWYQQVINYEIRPLLEEYWFDKPDRPNECVNDLLRGDDDNPNP